MSGSNDETIYIGVDGGGTKCLTIVSVGGETVGTGLGGGANPYQDYERAKQSILESCQAALHDAGLHTKDLTKAVVGMGLAGVLIPETYDQMMSWEHPFGHMYLTTDLHTACLGAHDGGDGAALVTGTGSCALTSVNGEQRMYGGYGLMLGDQGSGAWLGLEAVKAVMLAQDNLGPKTALSDMVEDALRVKGVNIISALMGATSSKFGKISPLVVKAAENGDAVAKSIMQSAAEYIENLTNRMLEDKPPRLSWIGGLKPVLTKHLKPEIAKLYEEPLQQPEVGAVIFAKQKHAESQV